MTDADLITAELRAQQIARRASAAYWQGVSDGSSKGFLCRQMRLEFEELAEVMGYRVERLPDPAIERAASEEREGTA